MTQKRPSAHRVNRSYEIGYGKPPVRTRFMKGRSGNPLGRPKSPTRLDSVLKAELDAEIKLGIDGKFCEISKREAVVRRLFAKALHGEIGAIEIFLQHIRKIEAANPPPSYIIKYYKDNLGHLQPTQDGLEAGDSKDAISSPRMDGISTAAQHDAGGDATASNFSGDAPARRIEQVIADKEDGASSCCTGHNSAITQPHAPRDKSNGEASPDSTTIRMRAPKPHQKFYVSPVDHHSGWYSSDADGIITNVHLNHIGPLSCAGCRRL